MNLSEHVVMMILSLIRNYIPSYQWIITGGWISRIACHAPMISKRWRLVRLRPAASAWLF